MRRLPIRPFFFLAIGLGVWALSAYLYMNARQFIAHGEHARGTVTGFRRSRSSYYYPVVAFKTAEGTQIEFVENNGSSSPAFVKGQQVEVIYMPENPNNAKINTFSDLWALPLFLAIFGTIFSLVGFAVIFVPWKTRHTAADLRVHGTPGVG